MRAAAAEALGMLRSSRAVGPLVESLYDKPDVAAAAAAALARIGAPAVEPLVAALHGAKHPVPRASWEWSKLSLADGRVSLKPHLLSVQPPAAGVVLGRIGAPAFESLLAALGSTNADVRIAAAAGLGVVGDRRAVEPLLVALSDADRFMRAAAAQALGAIGDARAADALAVALTDRDRDVKRQALWALSGMRDARAISEQMAALGGVDLFGVGREREVEALTWIGAPAVEPLLEALHHRNRDVRGAAARALGAIGDPNSVDDLAAATKDREPTVQAQAALALCAITDARVVEPLLAVLEKPEKVPWEVLSEPATAAFVRIGAPAVEPLVGALMNSSIMQWFWSHLNTEQGTQWLLKLPALSALAQIGSPAVEPLLALLGDKNGDVRARAAAVLGQIGDVRAVASLVSLLADRDSSKARTSAVNALGAIAVKLQPWAAGAFGPAGTPEPPVDAGAAPNVARPRYVP